MSDRSRQGPRSLLLVLAWAALYAAGQWAAFRLTSLVPFSTYPHLAEWSEVLRSQRAELAVLIAQTLAVTTALLGAVSLRAARQVIQWFGAGRAALVLSIIAVSLAVPTRDDARFAASPGDRRRSTTAPGDRRRHPVADVRKALGQRTGVRALEPP
jgi:hypothetical protein